LIKGFLPATGLITADACLLSESPVGCSKRSAKNKVDYLLGDGWFIQFLFQLFTRQNILRRLFDKLVVGFCHQDKEVMGTIRAP
jgi:hypothetical protein